MATSCVARSRSRVTTSCSSASRFGKAASSSLRAFLWCLAETNDIDILSRSRLFHPTAYAVQPNEYKRNSFAVKNRDDVQWQYHGRIVVFGKRCGLRQTAAVNVKHRHGKLPD